jgi:hypothetical protein
MKNTNIINLTSQDSIPQASSGTGTISSAGSGQHIVGSGTAFLTELDIDDWIYIKGQNELKKVEVIMSDTELYLTEAFTVALSGSAFHITPASRYTEISFLVSGASNVTVDGIAFTTGTSQTYSKSSSNGSFNQKFVDPIDVNATGSGVLVTVLS